MYPMFCSLRLSGLLLVLLVACGNVWSAPTVHSANSRYFEIFGLHPRSVSYVQELSALVGRVGEDLFEPQQMAFPNQIFVTLRPEQYVDFEGLYRVRIGARNAVELELRWTENTTIENACLALSEALLIQCALFNYGPQATSSVQPWTLHALATVARLELRPALLVDLRKEVSAQSLPELSRISDFHDPELSPYGYWLLRALKNSSLPNALVRRLFQRAVGGVDIRTDLNQIFESQTRDETANIWWQTQIDLLLRAGTEAIEAMEDSREWLSSLIEFGQSPLPDDPEVSLNLGSLWKMAEVPAVRELIEARYEILRLRMTRINPAYFTAARSLGIVLESFLEGEAPHRYLAVLTTFLRDFEAARSMERAIQKRMPSREL